MCLSHRLFMSLECNIIQLRGERKQDTSGNSVKIHGNVGKYPEVITVTDLIFRWRWPASYCTVERLEADK